MNKKIYVGIAVVLLILIIGIWISKNYFSQEKSPIRIGVITALTGDFAFWGESSRAGIELAKQDLKNQGINAEFIIEDGNFDPVMALTAAQKLVDIDKVQGIYSEFNPAAITVSSFVRGKNILHIYDAAPVSPLENNPLVYKSYIDYKAGCGAVADLFKQRRIKKVGVLKDNLEFGDICLGGVKQVFGDNVYVEEYNPGTTDFRSQLAKLNQEHIEALFNVAPPAETISSIKNLRTLKMNILFAGVLDAFSPDVVVANSNILNGVVVFGLPPVSDEFTAKINQILAGAKIGNYQAAALAYIHAKQIAIAITSCNGDAECIQKNMDNAKEDPSIGFKGFFGHIALFSMPLQEFKDGQFVNVK